MRLGCSDVYNKYMSFDTEVIEWIGARITEMLEDASRRILVAVSEFIRKAEALQERLIRRQCGIGLNSHRIANISEGVEKIAQYLEELGAELRKPVLLSKFVPDTNPHPACGDATQEPKQLSIGLPLPDDSLKFNDLGINVNAGQTQSNHQMKSTEASIAFKEEIRRQKQMNFPECTEKSNTLKFSLTRLGSARIIHSSSRKKRAIEKEGFRNNLQKGH